MPVSNRRSVSLALSVATLLVSACGKDPAKSTDDGSLVRCEGINTCKGQSECASADGRQSCQGHNDCAGKGWISVPESECREKGGKIFGTDASSATPEVGMDGAQARAAADQGFDAPAAPTDVPMQESDQATLADSDAMGDGSAVRCEGINTCKGSSECAAADGSSACRGLNECAGHGWIFVPSTEDCVVQGGKVLS